jgi:hypothetical protein
MLTVSSSIDSAALQLLLVEGSLVVFEDTQCNVTSQKGSLVGESPYGYVDFLMRDNSNACEALLLWSRSWASFSPSCAY